MANAWIQQGLIVVLATLVSGCSTWTGPRVMAEDRKVPAVDRPKTVASKAAPGAKESEKASPRKTASRNGAEKPREERLVTAPGSRDLSSAKENTRPDTMDAKEILSLGARAGADAMSGDYQLLDMKPEKHSLR